MASLRPALHIGEGRVVELDHSQQQRDGGHVEIRNTEVLADQPVAAVECIIEHSQWP